MESICKQMLLVYFFFILLFLYLLLISNANIVLFELFSTQVRASVA